MEGAANSLFLKVESRELSRENVYTGTQKEHLDTSAILAELIVKHDPTPFSLITPVPKFHEKATAEQYTAGRRAFRCSCLALFNRGLKRFKRSL